jgi:S-adenosyl-L-methionine hydrolase (adenosine-forming)
LKPSGIITLTTDFGESDPYVAMMKGVILTINPDATIIDITHQIPARAIKEGGLVIKASYTYFPSGTVHVGVVDPGVGGKRRSITILAGNYFFVGPDNGLFSTIIETQHHPEIIHLKKKKYWMDSISPTFHGRDIFAPVAAHLSLGINPLSMGEKIDHLTLLTYPPPRKMYNHLIGEITRVDHFGNLITNITKEHLSPWLASKNFIITVGRLRLKKIFATYNDVPAGHPLALIGNSNLLEIAVNMGRAIDYVGQDEAIGAKVEVNSLQSSR